MARTNPKATLPSSTVAFTHQGGPAYLHMAAEQALRRSVMSCLLWENTFYEDGVEIADRITDLAGKVSIEALARIAREARERFHLRHVPLQLLTVLIKRGSGNAIVADTIEAVIKRADEPGELLALYAKANGRDPGHLKPLAGQLKKGLRRAIRRFDAYELAKYNRDTAVRVRDVLMLTHGKPRSDEQAVHWSRLINKTVLPAATSSGFPVAARYPLAEGEAVKLDPPDTWEVALSAGADKRATFERLIREDKLGYLALLRNLRNMEKAGVSSDLINAAIIARRGSRRVLPFRYVAAARACPAFEPAIDKALVDAVAGAEPLSGKTAVLVDVSGSMEDPLSAKSDLKRIDAACALASVVPGEVGVWSFSDQLVRVPARKGMAGVNAIQNSQTHSGTQMGHALRLLMAEIGSTYDRLIVVTDEQAADRVPEPKNFKRAYLINVAPYKTGVGYGKSWIHIDGFSEAVFNFIREVEAGEARR